MDLLLRDTVTAVVQSRYPEMGLEARKLIESIAIRHEVKKGELYLKEGEISENMIFVGEGMLRQYYLKNKKDVTEHFSYEGCIVMCIESMLLHEPSKLMIQALENSVIYAIPFDKLIKLTERSYDVNMFYRKILEHSLITSQKKADSLRFESAKERYLRLLKNQPQVVNRAPLTDIASYLIMTPETLSRVRSAIL